MLKSSKFQSQITVTDILVYNFLCLINQEVNIYIQRKISLHCNVLISDHSCVFTSLCDMFILIVKYL